MEHQGQVVWDPPCWLQWAVSSCWSKSSCFSTSWSIAPAGELVSDAGVLDTHCPYLPKHDGLLTWRPWTPSQTYVICSAQSTALGLALTSWSSSLASFLRRGVNNHQCGSWQWVLYHWPQRPLRISGGLAQDWIWKVLSQKLQQKYSHLKGLCWSSTQVELADMLSLIRNTPWSLFETPFTMTHELPESTNEIWTTVSCACIWPSFLMIWEVIVGVGSGSCLGRIWNSLEKWIEQICS